MVSNNFIHQAQNSNSTLYNKLNANLDTLMLIILKIKNLKHCNLTPKAKVNCHAAGIHVKKYHSIPFF